MGLLFTNGGKYEYNYYNRNSDAKVSKKGGFIFFIIADGIHPYK